MKDVAVIVLSHKRAGKVTTHRHIAKARICVPESQYEQYKEHHTPDALVAHPDSVVGLPAKRQWVIEQFPGVMMLDDDCTGMSRLYRLRGIGAGPDWRRSTVAPNTAYDIVQSVADTARAVGAYFFGFNNHASPMSHRDFRPFRFGGYTPGGSMGILPGSKLWFPKVTLPIDDYWICLLNAFYHRFAWLDWRFAFGFKETYHGAGGMAELRVGDAERAATKYLIEHFGNKVIQRKVNQSGATRHEQNRWARLIVLPYRA